MTTSSFPLGVVVTMPRVAMVTTTMTRQANPPLRRSQRHRTQGLHGAVLESRRSVLCHWVGRRGVLVHDVERSMDGGVGGAVHSLPPGPVRMAPPLPSPSPEEIAAATNATASASAGGAGLKTPAKPAKVTTRSMTASRRLRSGRRGAAGAGTAGAETAGGAARGAGGFSAGAISDDDTPQPMPAVWKKGAITGLAWSRVSPPHPSWETTEAEEEREDAWRYRSHYLDKSSIFCHHVRTTQAFLMMRTSHHRIRIITERMLPPTMRRLTRHCWIAWPGRRAALPCLCFC